MQINHDGHWQIVSVSHHHLSPPLSDDRGTRKNTVIAPNGCAQSRQNFNLLLLLGSFVVVGGAVRARGEALAVQATALERV
jgi:hypothetical protein